MHEPTDKLIETLAREAKPVKPMWSPRMRAAGWLAAAAAAFTLVVVITGAGHSMLARFGDPLYAIEFLGTMLTGATAIVAAATISIPGRSWRWTLLPLPSALLWIVAASIRCAANTAPIGPVWASANCFWFITMISMPLAIALFVFLRRVASINLVNSTALGGLGVAALATTLLQFFHPEGTSAVDFITHVAAILTIVGFMSTLGRGALGP